MWERITLYANVDISSDDTSDVEDLIESFTSLAFDGLYWLGADRQDIQLCDDLSQLMATLGIRSSDDDTKTALAQVAALAILARRYQEPIRDILKWLSNPMPPNELGEKCVNFISLHGSDIQMVTHLDPTYDPTDETAHLTWEQMDRCRSVVSPVCKFFKDQIERHDNGREKLREVFPFGICDRPGCGKFRMIKHARPGPFFHSNLCKATVYQEKKPKSVKAAYKRDNRATNDRNKPKHL